MIENENEKEERELDSESRRIMSDVDNV